MDQQPSVPQSPMQAQPVPLAPVPSPVAPQSMPTQETRPPDVLDTWPGAWHLYKHSRDAVRRNWKVLLGLLIVDLLFALIPSILIKNKGIAQLVEFLLSIPPSIAFIKVYLSSVREQKHSFGDALRSGFTPITYLKYVVNLFFLSAGATVSFLLLIVPFFFVFPRLILAPYFLLDKDMGPLEALHMSYKLTKGHVGKVWGIIGVTTVMWLIMITVIGIPYSIYLLFMYSASLALLYEFIVHSQVVPVHTDNAVPVSPPTQPQPPSLVPPTPGPQIPSSQPPLVQ